MQHIDASSLSSLPGRVAYLKAFLDFTLEDAAALHSAKSVVAPLVPTVLDAVYAKLLSFDITASSFVPRNTSYEDETAKSIQELTPESPQIVFRKNFLENYLVELVTADYESEKTWEYMDRVGIMHTGLPDRTHTEKGSGFRVEYIHVGLLLGYVVDILLSAVLGADLDIATKTKVLKAFNKIIWIQNDLFARHY
ncbi:hypothetical protein PILCRDRAFT_73492 [Piloderma croceum F 1598]|uniref:Globin-sensor domain-containing protein n=1 Tax=Piloderma croceum (strain F 1598) TaxID=765440 RepID=A0A0C3F6C0_PILCF|nr:hypothetical protein PILCRDRAFT_73492 [Piloderma croceum F 1598]